MRNFDQWHREFELRLNAILGDDKPGSVLAKYGISLSNEPDLANEFREKHGLQAPEGKFEDIRRGLRAKLATPETTESSSPSILDELGFVEAKQETNISEVREREPSQEELNMIDEMAYEHHLKFFRLQRQVVELYYRAREQHTMGVFQVHRLVREIESFREDTPGVIEGLEGIVQIMQGTEKVGWKQT